jgi:hypothetical protein
MVGVVETLLDIILHFVVVGLLVFAVHIRRLVAMFLILETVGPGVEAT